MGFPTKVQLIKRASSEQWYINFPSALAKAMEFNRGETVEWIIEDRAQLVLRRLEPPKSAKKKTAHGILEEFEELFEGARPGFKQARSLERARALALANLVCFGRHTITGMITTTGGQFRDWTSDYRLFSQGNFQPESLFRVVRREVVDQLGEGDPLVVVMDDTLMRKSGSSTPGVAWRRDPLGPRFQVNFVRAQRALQLSAALPCQGAIGSARTVPIGFYHAPTPKRPGKKGSKEEWKAYRQAAKASSITSHGVRRLNELREAVDDDPEGKKRTIWAVVDGGYTNGTVLKQLPDRTVLIGRIRADAKLHFPAVAGPGKGRPRVYGPQAPTPEALRQDESVPWRTVKVHAAGTLHSFRYKRIDSLLWRTAGQRHSLSLIVIAPLGYRKRQGGPMLYRKPAYLVCTDPSAPTNQIIQAYVWRWGIEVNHRDEKTLLGLGQAQVRHERSVETVPALTVASYAMLILAACKSLGAARSTMLPAPKWRRDKPRQGPGIQDLINQLRAELWGRALGRSTFSDFAKPHATPVKPEKRLPRLESAVLYAAG